MEKEKIKEEIMKAAAARRLLYYEDLLPAKAGDAERRNLYRILGEINDEDTNAEDPTTLVISKETGMPGPGYFRETDKKPSDDDAFGYFAEKARKLYRRHSSAPQNYGVIVDAEQHHNARKVDDFLRKRHGVHAGIVCRGCGTDDSWDSAPLERHEKSADDLFILTLPDLRDKKETADFYLVMAGVQIIQKTHQKRLLDVLYIFSGDHDFGHFQHFAHHCDRGLVIKCIDNQLKIRKPLPKQKFARPLRRKKRR